MSGCAMADGSMCSGPSPSKAPLNQPAFDCDTAKCPVGYKCAYGMHPECCETKEFGMVLSSKTFTKHC
uniref:Granulins domain-containing protein n=1 Tax=Panagrolaimus superbus TaxID=310955 RepID=A0A914Y4I3_9BILA